MGVIEDTLLDVKNTLSRRLKNPLVGAFIVSWIFFNWKPIAYFFRSNENILLILEKIDPIFYPSWWVIGGVNIGIVKLCYTLVFPLTVAWIYRTKASLFYQWIDDQAEEADEAQLKRKKKQDSQEIQLEAAANALRKSEEAKLEQVKENAVLKVQNAKLNREKELTAKLSKELQTGLKQLNGGISELEGYGPKLIRQDLIDFYYTDYAYSLKISEKQVKDFLNNFKSDLIDDNILSPIFEELLSLGGTEMIPLVDSDGLPEDIFSIKEPKILKHKLFLFDKGLLSKSYGKHYDQMFDIVREGFTLKGKIYFYLYRRFQTYAGRKLFSDVQEIIEVRNNFISTDFVKEFEDALAKDADDNDYDVTANDKT